MDSKWRLWKPENKQSLLPKVPSSSNMTQPASCSKHDFGNSKRLPAAPQRTSVGTPTLSGPSLKAVESQAKLLLQQRRKSFELATTQQIDAKDSTKQQRTIQALQQKLTSKEQQVSELKQQLKDQKKQHKQELQERKKLVKDQQKQLEKQQKKLDKQQLRPDVHQIHIMSLKQQLAGCKDKLALQQQQYEDQQQQLQQCLQQALQLSASNARLKAQVQALHRNSCHVTTSAHSDELVLPAWFLSLPLEASCCNAMAAVPNDDDVEAACDGLTADCSVLVVPVAPAQAASAKDATIVSSIADGTVKPASEAVTATLDTLLPQDKLTYTNAEQEFTGTTAATISSSSPFRCHDESSAGSAISNNRVSTRWWKPAAMSNDSSSSSAVSHDASARWWFMFSTLPRSWQSCRIDSSRCRDSREISFSRGVDRKRCWLGLHMSTEKSAVLAC